MKWQPIATAPKDGTAVLLYGGQWQGEVSSGYEEAETPPLVCEWRGGYWAMCDTEYYEVRIENPTHWMPLPEPPQEGE